MTTLSPEATPTLTSVAAFLDDVWAPEGLLRMATQESPPKIAEEIKRAQRRAFHHALLHSKQILVNRSYWFENAYLRSIWTDPTKRSELVEVLTPPRKDKPNKGVRPAAATFLFGEEHPSAYRSKSKKEVPADVMRQWEEFWRQVEGQGKVESVVLDEKAKRADMPGVFRAYFRDEAPRYSEGFARRFRLSPDEAVDLRQLLDKAGELASGEADFSRVVLYENLLGEVPTDANCAYARYTPAQIALKLLIDTRYGVNLADAIDRSSTLGEDTPDRAILQQTEALSAGAAAADLQALAQLTDNFLRQAATPDVPYMDPGELELKEVLELRTLPTWEVYTQTAERLLHVDNRALSDHPGQSRDLAGQAHESLREFWSIAPGVVQRLRRQERTIQTVGLLFQVMGAGAQLADFFVEAGGTANRVLEVIDAAASGAAELAEGVMLISYVPLTYVGAARLATNKVPLLRVRAQDAGEVVRGLRTELGLKQTRTVTRVPDAIGAEHRDADA